MENIEDYEGPQEKNGPAVEDGAVQELKKGGKDLQDIHRQVNQGSEDWMQVFKHLSILSVQKYIVNMFANLYGLLGWSLGYLICF